MCLGSKPALPPVKEPIDRQAVAAQKAYNRAQDRPASQYNEGNTDVVGSLIAKQSQPQVSTSLKSLMGSAA